MSILNSANMALLARILRTRCPNLTSGIFRKYSETLEPATIEDVVSTPAPISPILTRELEFPTKSQKPREVWIENMDSIEEVKRGMVCLHPRIFATMPRLDLIARNVNWQNKYRVVKTFHLRNRAECKGGGRKPWPQKGLGKARQGSIRAPQFKGGGAVHGPRNPTSFFYMLPYHMRLHGLTSTLSVKFAQDDIHVVDNLEMPVDDREFILNLAKERSWGCSVLFVDDSDIMPRNITAATDTIGHFNLMPVYGLNVLTMLKHDTLVLTLAAVNRLESQLLYHLNNIYDAKWSQRFRHDQGMPF